MTPPLRADRQRSPRGRPSGARRLLATGIALAALGALPATSCTSAGRTATTASQGDAHAATISVTATGTGLDVTGTGHLHPGWTRLTASNPTDADHAVELVRLHDGVTVDRFRDGLQTPDGQAALRLAEFYGGTDDIRHHTTWTMTVDLDPGHYILVDHAQGPQGPEGPAWFTLPGFLRDFTVTDGPRTDAQPPSTTTTLHMRDFTFDLPPTLPRRGTIEVRSSGQLHQASMLKLTAETTVTQALAAVRAGEIPAGEPVEFLGIVSPGHTLYLDLDLEPGRYIIASFMPDVDHDGAPQAAQGMTAAFTVN